MDHRDELKRPNKPKHEERTKKIEIDEFCRNQWHRMIRCRVTGVSG
jgi:hypothetical protein